MHTDRAQLVDTDFIGSFLAMLYGDIEGADALSAFNGR